MRVLVLGGYGLIGSAIVRRLVAEGHTVLGLGRDTHHAALSYPQVQWITADLSTLTSPRAWDALLLKTLPEAVVNAAGALQDGLRDQVSTVQLDAMRALYAAAERHGTTRLVQISAIRASPDADTAFMRSKGEADVALAASGLDWTILRPGLVIAPQAYGGTALLRALAAMPLVQPLVYANSPIQTVSVDDVAAATADALAGRVPLRRAYDLVEADARPLRDVIAGFRCWLGYAPRPEIHLPVPLVKAAARVGDALGWLGWRPPLRSTAITELAAGVTGSAAPWRAATDRCPLSFEETLARMPATIQDRWFARLFLLKPLILATLSAFWCVTGILSLMRPEAAMEVLTTRGVAPNLANLIATGGAVVDLALGLSILWRSLVPMAAKGMIAVTLCYLIGGTLLTPDLWADPLGPLIKAIPAAVLALVALALAEDR